MYIYTLVHVLINTCTNIYMHVYNIIKYIRQIHIRTYLYRHHYQFLSYCHYISRIVIVPSRRSYMYG